MRSLCQKHYSDTTLLVCIKLWNKKFRKNFRKIQFHRNAIRPTYHNYTRTSSSMPTLNDTVSNCSTSWDMYSWCRKVWPWQSACWPILRVLWQFNARKCSIILMQYSLVRFPNNVDVGFVIVNVNVHSDDQHMTHKVHRQLVIPTTYSFA